MENKVQHFRQLCAAADHLAPAEKLAYQLTLFPLLIHALTASSAIHFHTLFARVAYLTSRQAFAGPWSYALQVMRREVQGRVLQDEMAGPLADRCNAMLLYLLDREEGDAAEGEGLPMPPAPVLPPGVRHTGQHKAFARMVVSAWDRATKTVSAIDEEVPDQLVTIHYAVADVNDVFAATLEETLDFLQLPLVVGLADIRYPEPGHAIPGFIVVQPDYLVQVTEIARMLPAAASPILANLADWFVPSGEKISLLKGQVANLFLDELVRAPGLAFGELIQTAFRAFPVHFSCLTDAETLSITNDLRVHFDTILHVVTEIFPQEEIDRAQCHIEPSYYSPRYGLKGRLDLFHEKSGGSPTIIELKSSKLFRPNHYQLNEEHYRQTLLYDLIIQSAHKFSGQRRNFILYSGQAQTPMRFAAPAEGIQKELIHGRNQLLLLAHMLMQQGRPGTPDLFSKIHPAHCPDASGFALGRIRRWADVYGALPEPDKAYFKAFAGFIAREHTLASIGRDMGEGSGGMAGLWLDTADAKEARYELLQGLHLIRSHSDSGQTIVQLGRTPATHPLANFRESDIVVMYPQADGMDSDPTQGQLYRATILEIDQQTVTIRLRNAQVNLDRLSQGSQWALEPDMMDSGFMRLYQSLWMLMSANAARRAVLLGRSQPGIHASSKSAIPVPVGMTPVQGKLFAEGIRAEGLYVLWGPPGTGKTSVMLRAWVNFYLDHRPSRLLVLAYTNRAVDEICATIAGGATPDADRYIRIGSRSGTGSLYRHRLLEAVIAPLRTRRAIRDCLQDTRVFVGTVSSFLGRQELFDLIRFDVAIVDEASQLLEPAITGLLTRVDKAILIGDHMQLPAVSQQTSAEGMLSDVPPFAEIFGLTDLRMSYFERLYRTYQARGWFGSIGTLHEQGRMHADIMAAANALVYGGSLVCLEESRLQISMAELFPDEDNWLTRCRLAAVDVPSAPNEWLSKTARHETVAVIRLIQAWKHVFRHRGLDWRIGVITPFRAQIAAILHAANQVQLDMKDVSVDTVERYQGGARDIIILSTVVGHSTWLERIVSPNSEGQDRKLNVALTRAREQFILVGDVRVLEQAPSYRQLLSLSSRVRLHDLSDPAANPSPA